MNNRDCLGSVAKVAAHVIRSWSGYGISAPSATKCCFFSRRFHLNFKNRGRRKRTAAADGRKLEARVWETWCRLRWCHYKPTCNIIRSCIILLHVMLFFSEWLTLGHYYIYVTSIDGGDKAQQMNIHRHITAQLFENNNRRNYIINSPSDKPTCCWWLPVLGSGPDSSCRQCNYPKLFGIYKIVWNLLAVYIFPSNNE